MEKSVNSNNLSYARALASAGVLAQLFVFGCGDTVDDALGGGDGDAFTAIYESDEFQTCSGCHAPGAPGIVDGIETTQNWSTRDTAHSTLQRNAAGMIGNNEGCNGVPFLGDTAEQSLLVAAFDEDVRANFELAAFPDCTSDAIADQTLKIGGALPAALLQDLKDWVNDGAP
jgi:hypothetical protein